MYAIKEVTDTYSRICITPYKNDSVETRGQNHEYIAQRIVVEHNSHAALLAAAIAAVRLLEDPDGDSFAAEQIAMQLREAIGLAS